MAISNAKARYWMLRFQLTEAEDTSFCSVLAFMLATGMTDHERANNMLGRKPRRGIPGQALLSALSQRGYKTRLVRQVNSGYVRNVVKNAAKKGVDLSTGTYLVFSTRHVSCLKDGELLDWTGQPSAVNVRVWGVYSVELGKHGYKSYKEAGQ